MKKMLSLLLCLCMIAAFAVPASAEKYVDLGHLEKLVNNITDKDVNTFDLSDDEQVLAIIYENDTDATIGFFALDGTHDQIIQYILIMMDEGVPDSDVNEALIICSEWNNAKRYPRLYLDDDNCFVADGFLFCTADVTDGMIEEFADDMIFGTGQLFDFLVEKGYSRFADMK